MKVRAFLASVLTEDDNDSVPDLSRIAWALLALMLMLGILVFFVLTVILAIAVVRGAAAGFGALKDYAEAFGMLFTGAGGCTTLCATALGIKTRSGA